MGNGSLSILKLVGRNLVFGATVHFRIAGFGRNCEGHQACSRAISEVNKANIQYFLHLLHSSTPDHSFRFASSRFHGRLRFLHEYCDEVGLLLQILLQQHQLRHHRALFEEHFYGLERDCDGRTERRIARALIFSVLAPYLKAKLDNIFEKAREDEVDGISCRVPLLTRSRRLLLVVYPYLHFAYEASVFVYYLAYALEKARTQMSHKRTVHCSLMQSQYLRRITTLHGLNWPEFT